MMPSTRPGGRTVPSRRIIGGRMALGEVKREVVEAFRLGMTIAEQRHERAEDMDGYERGFADAMRMVDEDDARAARPVPQVDLGGLGYSEYFAVYAVMEDLGGIAPEEYGR